MTAISNITNAADMIGKMAIDSTIGQACSQNKTYYRVTQVAPAGITIFPKLIPLKPPCIYMLSIKWQAMSSGGGVIIIYFIYQINQTVSGGSVSQTAPVKLLEAASAGDGNNTITIAKNSTSDALDITFNNTPTGGIMTSIIEFEVISNKNF